MTLDLNGLARRVAEELARADQKSHARDGAAGSPPTSVLPSEARAPAPAGVSYVRDQARIADFIDHTLLKAEATRSEVEKLCAEARDQRFAAVCVNPVWVELCRHRLKGSQVKVATVIGFPLGASQSETKAAEASLAVRQGADEVDMVAAIGHIKSGDWGHVAADISAVVREAAGRVVKVIIESAALSPVEIIKACALARESGAQYVKTSTGFHSAGGASAEAVALMRLSVGDALGVKASGGVRDCETALKMIAAGATRIGTSSGVAMAQCLGRGPLPLGELLSGPGRHASQCATGVCSTGDKAAQSY
ncbi:MAG: deoxyribose-phosphate aldolase [Anaerolineae bacterium]|nr:deoxyribose-phosphate aldolase [Gemmatimonadaceae bacterium]